MFSRQDAARLFIIIVVPGGVSPRADGRNFDAVDGTIDVETDGHGTGTGGLGGEGVGTFNFLLIFVKRQKIENGCFENGHF